MNLIFKIAYSNKLSAYAFKIILNKIMYSFLRTFPFSFFHPPFSFMANGLKITRRNPVIKTGINVRTKSRFLNFT